MKTLKKLVMLSALAASALTLSAQVFDFNVDPAKVIPDGDVNGIQDTRTVSGAGPFTQGMMVKVKLNIQGADSANNGDYYVTLAKAGTDIKAVLLNRPGKPLNAGAGYGDNGMNVTLQDWLGTPGSTAANDIHNYKSIAGYGDFLSPLTGIWAPDGRNADPSLVTANRADAINQPLKMLSVFQNTDPNGDWTLFAADMASGGQGKLVSWGLEFVAVPEPHEYALIAGLALIGFALYRRYSLKTA